MAHGSRTVCPLVAELRGARSLGQYQGRSMMVMALRAGMEQRGVPRYVNARRGDGELLVGCSQTSGDIEKVIEVVKPVIYSKLVLHDPVDCCGY